MKCFVDTSAYLAVMDRSDRFHSAAAELWELLLGGAANELVTTNYVLVEAIALIQSRLGLSALRSFSTSVLPVLRVVWIDRDTHERAMASLLSQPRRRLSLVDCSSFEVMRNLGIADCFAFDQDFADQGFQLLENSSQDTGSEEN